MKPYEILPDSQTFQVKIFGQRLEDLYANAAKGMFAAMVGSLPLNGDLFSDQLKIESVDHETLLIDWLTKLLELASMEGVAVREVTIKQLTDNTLVAEIQGSYVDEFEQEISEVLVDDLAIHELEDGFETTITFSV